MGVLTGSSLEDRGHVSVTKGRSTRSGDHRERGNLEGLSLRSGLVPGHGLLPVVDALADDVRGGVACGVELLVKVDREDAGLL